MILIHNLGQGWRTMKKYQIFFILASIFFIINITMLIIDQKNTHTEKGDCYDSMNNKINELTCEVKINPNQGILFSITGIMSMLGATGFAVAGLLNKLNRGF